MVPVELCKYIEPLIKSLLATNVNQPYSSDLLDILEKVTKTKQIKM